MSGVKGLLAVLVLAGGLGGFNYHRNLTAEAAEPRPFAGYSQGQITALISAYQSEVETLDRRYQARRGDRARQKGGALLDQRLDDYERAASHGAKQRRLAGDLSETEAALIDLRQELAARAEGPWQVHVRRLLTL